MIIDLRADLADFRDYVCRLINEHVRRGDPRLRMIHFGFTFDQDGWINAYFDTRPNASRDGEWTTHLRPDLLLARPHWYEASELGNLGDLILIDTEGKELREWPANPTIQKLASFLGEFLRSSVSSFEAQGLFQRLLGQQKLNYCVEEFTGLYGWPIDPEVAKLGESLKLSGHDSSSHD
jgi:hypothetical protein